MEFLKAFRKFIEHRRTSPIRFERRAENTIGAYGVRYRAVNDYLISVNKVKIKCIDFNVKHAKAFYRILSATKSNNYAARNVDLCRSVLDYALDEEFIKYNPLGSFSLKKTGPSAPVFLTAMELKRFENHQPKTDSLKKVKLMFLFQCYTGLDYGDLMTLKPKDFVTYKGRDFIVKKRNKTKIEACAPYTPQARAIMDYFQGSIPKMSNQCYNRSIKKIATAVGIDKRITSHIGRKTHGMHMLNYKGYSIEAVSKILGHKYISTTETYYVTVEIDLVVREMESMERAAAALAIA